MAVKEIRRESVEKALDEFRSTCRGDMLEKYGGRPSREWYIEIDGKHFDQNLIVRAAHRIQGLGEIAPRGSVKLDSGQATNLLERLGYLMVQD